MLKKLKELYTLGVHNGLNTYDLLKLQIVNRLTVLCIIVDPILIVINTIIGNHLGVAIDIITLVFVLIPVLYLNHRRLYLESRYLFVIGYHIAVFSGCWNNVVVGRVNEVELLLLPGAIGLMILLQGKGQILFYLTNMAALAWIKYMRWESLQFDPNGYYKLLAMIVITYIGIYYFIIQFKTQLMLALENSEFLNKALKTNEKELKESNKAKDRLFSIVAHDLRSPLDLVKGLLDPAVLVNLDKEELINYQTTIRSRIGMLQETMNNLLNWAQTQLGKLEVSPVNVSVIQESKAVVDLFNEMIDSKEIRFQYAGNREGMALVDKDHFTVIMRNIIHNAIKFTPKKGHIILEATQSPEGVSIAVIDSGSGIDHPTMNKILNCQLMESEAGTDGERGSGVGLSFCHELIKKNNGALGISGNSSGGTRFEVKLPVAQ